MKRGFTFIEVLVVVVIIGVLVAIVGFSLSGAKANAEDNARRADLAKIASGLAKYRSDCGHFPASVTFGSSLVGDDSSASCDDITNIYLNPVPQDPDSGRSYDYVRIGQGYFVCASLAGGGSDVAAGCGGLSCGNGVCNYSVKP